MTTREQTLDLLHDVLSRCEECDARGVLWCIADDLLETQDSAPEAAALLALAAEFGEQVFVWSAPTCGHAGAVAVRAGAEGVQVRTIEINLPLTTL